MKTRTLWWSAVLGGAFAAILSACGGTVDSGNGGSTTTTTTTVQLTACEKYELAFTACCKTFSEPAKTACLDAAASMSWGTLDASACTAAYNAFSCPGTGTGGYAGGGGCGGGCGGYGGYGGGGGGSAPSCYSCACDYLVSEGGCMDVCDKDYNGNPSTLNFCDGVNALPVCAACILNSCGESDPNSCGQ